MTRRKHKKHRAPPSNAEILEQLRTNFYALIGLQAANAKTTEKKYTQIDPKSRKEVKAQLKRKFAGLRPDQIERQLKQRKSRRKKAR